MSANHGGFEDGWTNRFLSRRRVLRGGLLGGAGLAAAALIGCDDDDDDAATATSTAAATPAAGGGTATAAGQPKYGGEIRVSQTRTMSDVMDPHTSTTQAGALLPNTLDHAVRLSMDGSEIVPDLVASWEIAPDVLSATLTVQPNAKWHNKPPVNGRQVDAQDIAYNLLRITGALEPDEGQRARYQRRSTLTGMENAEAVDNEVVRVTFDRPTGIFLGGLSDFRNLMAPRDFLEGGGQYEDTASIVGSGPFIIESFRGDERATWVRNPDYWRTGLPYLDAVRWDWVPDRVSQQTAFAQGALDLFTSPTKLDFESIQRLNADFQEVKWRYGGWLHQRFHAKKEPFTDARVRKALAWVVDIKTMGDLSRGEGFWEYSGPLVSAFAEALQPEELATMRPLDPAQRDATIAEARKLMDAAGFPNGEIEFPFLQSVASIQDNSIRAMDAWQTVWPDLKVELDLPGDFAGFQTRQLNGDFQMLNYGFGPQADPVLDMVNNYFTDGARNYGKFSDPKVDEALDKAFGQTDFEERKETLREVQLYVMNDVVPLISLFATPSIIYYAPNIRGLENVGAVGNGTYGLGEYDKFLWIADA